VQFYQRKFLDVASRADICAERMIASRVEQFLASAPSVAERVSSDDPPFVGDVRHSCIAADGCPASGVVQSPASATRVSELRASSLFQHRTVHTQYEDMAD